MNSSFEDLAAQIAAVASLSPWDNPPFQLPAAFAAYHHAKEQRHMKQDHVPAEASIVLAGVQSCLLATQVLGIKWGDPESADARTTVAAAESVLEHWGIELRKLIPDTDTAPIKIAPPTPASATLVWPPVDRSGRPLTTTLPDVYRENYYHARETTSVIGPTDTTHGYIIYPEHRLVLREAYWNEEALQWRMQFDNVSVPHDPFWIDHCKVRVGEEIPKVIDGATQARSNDP